MFPLQRGETWAWWALVASGMVGFVSFLSYLGYGDLDSWHGAATLVLLPLFVGGILYSRDLVSIAMPPHPFDVRSRGGLGRALLLLASAGIAIAGLVITTVGMTTVFVPQDLEYIGGTRAAIAMIGYLSLTHLAPAVLGMLVFAGGLVLAISGTLFARP